MPLRYESRWYTPTMLWAEPDALFVFGDNLARRGKGGQAVIRDEPNAVGIPTKHAPRRDEDAYFAEADLDRFREAATPALTRLRVHAEAGGLIVWPADGIGTGLAELPTRAPRIWAALERARMRLEKIANKTEGGHVE